MLVIRKEQMQSFRDAMVNSFKKRMAVHLRNVFPEETSNLSEQEIFVFVDKGMKKAKLFGIIYETDIKRFLELMIFFGTDLDENDLPPEVQKTLRSKEIDGREKLNKISSYVGRTEED